MQEELRIVLCFELQVYECLSIVYRTIAVYVKMLNYEYNSHYQKKNPRCHLAIPSNECIKHWNAHLTSQTDFNYNTLTLTATTILQDFLSR